MAFKEALPLQCPPADAVEDAIAEAYRMVFANPPTEEHFKSKKALGQQPLPGEDECGFASCSLYAKLTQAKRLAELPKPREKGALVAKLSIPSGSGRWKQNKKKHIHFWMYDTFDPLNAFIEMV